MSIPSSCDAPQSRYLDASQYSLESNHAVAFVPGTYGRRALLRGDWDDRMADFLKAFDVVEIELNMAKGWYGTNLSFFSKLPWLLSVEILDMRLQDVAPVHELHKLKELEITTYCKTPMDYSCFPELERCGLEWRPRSESVFDCTTLKKLFINRYKGKDTDCFSRLVNLEDLTLLNAPIRNLLGLKSLVKLQRIRIGLLRQLGSLTGIEQLVNLRELDINTCRRFRSLAPIESLMRLEKLFFSNCGEIESLRPLSKLTNLNWIGFCESTNILDGDLLPLMNLPNLERLSLKNRRHYSHKRQEFPAFHR